MFYDRHGQPDPNGDFQMIDGKQVLRDGRAIRPRVLMMDSASTPAAMADAAYEKSIHDLNAWRNEAKTDPAPVADHATMSDAERVDAAYQRSVASLNAWRC